jgi:hypothetical protein
MAAARALLAGRPDAAEVDTAAAAFGLVAPAAPLPECEVWAENWPAVRIFDRVQSQWRTGPGGPIGLDYSVLPASCKTGGRRGARLMRDVQIMEAEALRQFAKRE